MNKDVVIASDRRKRGNLVRDCFTAFAMTMLVTVIFSPKVFASPARMDSEGYTIQMPTINMGGARKEGSGKVITDSMGQTAPGRYERDGYIVRAGFQYVYSMVPFSFTITSLNIDFGALMPNTPATASNQLIVSTGSAGGYQVSSFENTPLKVIDGADTIPNTICDDGLCTQATGSAWINNNVYGFGYTASGDDVIYDLLEGKYRQFADDSLNQTPGILMSRNTSTYNPPSHTRTATITYKVNIDSSQAAGKYENAVTYVCVPRY